MLPQQKMLAGTETGQGARRISSLGYIKTTLRHKPVLNLVAWFKVLYRDRARGQTARGPIALRHHYATRISGGQTDPLQIRTRHPHQFALIERRAAPCAPRLNTENYGVVEEEGRV
jgi:hypothetical protein